MDCPDRYPGIPETWWALAQKQVTPERSVVALCTTATARLLDVTAARLGAENNTENNTDDQVQETTA
jgi:hypothetical protein